MGVGGQRHSPAALTPVKETRYPLYRTLDGHRGRSRRMRKISPAHQGSNPRCPARLIRAPLLHNYHRHSYRFFTNMCNCRLLALLSPCFLTALFLHRASIRCARFDLCLTVHTFGPSCKRSRLKYQ